MSLLSPLPAPLTLNWLFDEGSLTRRLTRLSDDGFSVTPLSEGWQPLRDDECATLDLPAASIGWVREVYLRGHGQPWVFARSVAARSALQGDGLHMDELGSRSLGELLFCHRGVPLPTGMAAPGGPGRSPVGTPLALRPRAAERAGG
eukprot:gene1808-2080_t